MLLAKKGMKVNLWGREREKIESIKRSRENIFYLPGVVLPYGVSVTSDLESAVMGAKYLVLSVPSHSIREMCQRLRPYLKTGSVVINAAKGIETGTLKRLSEVISEELTGLGACVAVLSGPSHAEEVARDIPTAVVAGAERRGTAEEIQDLFMSPKFRVYTNPDLIGIELGAALKNVIALGTGIAEGLGYGDNSKAALITRGAAEIARLGVAAGANPLTFAGLTGIGDLIVTCTSMHSRNRRAGILIGRGMPVDRAVAEIGMVVEGIKATEAACALSEKYGVSMPICRETYHILFSGKNPREAVIDLMMRHKKHEVEEVALQETE
jgi:glycerol-3-phosphate dehydrogenase (NAD(P)+)